MSQIICSCNCCHILYIRYFIYSSLFTIWMSHSHSWFGIVRATPFSNSNWVSPGMAESCWDVNCSLTSSTMVTQMKQLPCWKGVKFPSICPLSYGTHQSECFNITFSVIFNVNSLAINVCVWPSDDCGTSKVCSFVCWSWCWKQHPTAGIRRWKGSWKESNNRWNWMKLVPVTVHTVPCLEDFPVGMVLNGSRRSNGGGFARVSLFPLYSYASTHICLFEDVN